MATDPIAKALGITSTVSTDDYEIPKFHVFDLNVCREDALKRNAEFVTCDRCGVRGNYPNMMRWHFESCKTVLRKCEQCGGIIPRQGKKDSQYCVKKFCNRKCYMASKKGKAPIVMTEEVKNKLRYPKSEEHKKKLSESRKKRYV